MRWALLVLAITVGGVPAGPASAHLSQMYTARELNADAKRLETAVRKIYRIVIEPVLKENEKRGLGDLDIRFPLPNAEDDILNFFAFRERERAVVVMPVLSLKALEDLTTAYAWVHTNGMKPETIDLYYAMLRHRAPENFPGGAYPDVLTALKIPKNAYEQPGVDTLSLRLRNTAFAFILAHELAHVIFRHKGYGRISRAQARRDETQADKFALSVLARQGVDPFGAVLYFQAQIYRFRHRGEFSDKLSWDDYLMRVATHPMSVDRLKAMADFISGPLAKKNPSDRVLWIAIGEILDQVRKVLEDPTLQQCAAQVAAKAPMEVLVPTATGPGWAFEAYCRLPRDSRMPQGHQN